MSKDIMNMIDVSTGPITLDITMAKELGWNREVITSLARSITLLVRGAGMTTAFITGRGCENCGRLQPQPGIECSACVAADPPSTPQPKGPSVEDGEGWTMCGNCGNANDNELTSCPGCSSKLEPVKAP